MPSSSKLARAEPGPDVDDLREANEKLVLAALESKELEATRRRRLPPADCVPGDGRP